MGRREQNLVNKYINKKTWRLYENANRIFSIGGCKTFIAEEIIKEYTLKHMPQRAAKAHKRGAIHIHDLAHGIGSYCSGWSILKILIQGLEGGPNTIYSRPAKHLSSALGQILNFAGLISQEHAGAQAFNSIDTLLAPFIYYDKLSYPEVKQLIQEFIFNLNVAFRFGHETPFTNITLDIEVPPDLANMPVIIGGQPQDKTYAEFDEERQMIARAIFEVLAEGDGRGGIFRFPIPTINIVKNFPWDTEVGEKLAWITGKFGLPYFQNCISSGISPDAVRSMCCRLQLDLTELRRKTGGLFGYNDETGSIGVITINLSQLGFLSKSESEFFDRLDDLLIIAKEALEWKRKIIEENFKRGLFPYTAKYLKNFDNHFSTIGVIAGEEMCRNFLNCSIADSEGQRFAIKVLKYIRERLKEFQQETGHLYNLEATPAEGASYRLARIDRKQFGNKIYVSGIGHRCYYVNSTLLPYNHGMDLIEVLRHQEPLQSLYSGGTVQHIFLGEQLADEECKYIVPNFINWLCTNFRIPYYSLTPTYSICRKCGKTHSGAIARCPDCGSECEIYSRVVGYYSPLQAWNPGKQEEFGERTVYRNIADAFSTF